MNCKSILKMGDRLVIKQRGKEFTTNIDEVMDESNFSILQPFSNGKPIELEPGDEYKVTCIKGGGIHSFNAIVVRTDLSGRVKVTYLCFTSDYMHLQRRNAFRCPMSLDAEIRKKALGAQEPQEWLQVKTMDVSETGMRVRLGTRFTKGDLLECNLKVNRFGIYSTLSLMGVIVREQPLPGWPDQHVCGIAFGDISPAARNTLLKLVTLGQRKSLGK